MVNIRSFGLVLALSLAFFGCGGGGGNSGASEATVGAPTNLTVKPGSYSGSLILTWKAPAQAITGYELEGKAEGEVEFQKLFNELIPPGYTGLELYFQTLPPEGGHFSFRLRATASGKYSSYSNEAVYEQGPHAPSSLAGTYDFDQKAVQLTWTRNSTTSDSYRLERATSDANGQETSTWTVLSGVGATATSFTDTTVRPETNYVYRITNLKGKVESSGATSPVVFTGLPKLSYPSAYYDFSRGCVLLSWYWPTTVPAQVKVRIERAEADVSGTPSGPWTPVALVEGSARSFDDQDFLEITRLLYRFTPVAGSSVGTTMTTSYPVYTPLLAPANIRLIPSTQGYRLEWENRSKVATEIAIRRTPNPNWDDEVALLGSSTTSYEDLDLPLGYYTYQLVARRGSDQGASAQLSAPMLNPAKALKLSAGAQFPTLSCGAIRPNGRWILGVHSPFGVRSDNDPWPALFPLDGSSLAANFLRVDAQGYPHAVYVKSTSIPATPFTVVHAWFDGTTWQKEDVLTTNIYRSSAQVGLDFALDSTGALHLILDQITETNSGGGSRQTLTYLRKSGGSWVQEAFSTFLDETYYNIGSYHIQVDGAGKPRILLGCWGKVVDCAKDAEGKWVVSTLPTGSVNAGWYDFLDARWADAANGWVFYESSMSGNGWDYGLMGVQCKDGVWQAPMLIASREHDGSSTRAQVAMSPDGSRVVVHQHSTLGERLFHLQDGQWVGTLVGFSGDLLPRVMGFDGNQKFHVLVQPDYSESVFQEYLEP